MTGRLAVALVALCVATIPDETAAGTRMVRIPAGAYRPLYGGSASRRVAAFEMDAAPVTSRAFLEFVRAHPEWRRSRASRLFVDEAYLRQWRGDLDPGPDEVLDAPVVAVSWFAARAYLLAMDKQLPTVDQWEYAAGLSRLPGVSGLHGPMAEWTLDFNAALVSGESRADGSLDRTLFCGAGAIGAPDARDYAAFTRFGFRNSLDARYSLANLTFRGVRVKHRAASPAAAQAAIPRASGAAGAGAASIFDLDVPLIDQDGTKSRLADLAGRPLVVTMMYASCTSVCPRVAEDMKALERALGPRAPRVRFVLFSLDPGRDSPQALRQFASDHGMDPARWRLFATSDDGVRTLANVLGVKYASTPGGEIAHAANIIVIDPRGVVRHRQTGIGQDPRTLLDAVTQAAK